MAPEIRILAESADLYRAAAHEFARRAKRAVQAQGRFAVALSGGKTPRGLYAHLAGDQKLRGQVPWEKVHFFWGDERHVPPDHADSNYRMAYETLLSKVPVLSANIHRIPAEYPAAEPVARQYERTLRAFFRLSAGPLPRFDLVLLGLGTDGHTASLFPGTPALYEQHRLVVVNWVNRLGANRITLTAPVFNNASAVIFLVSGADKAPPLRALVAGRQEADALPAQLIRPIAGELVWLVDRAAARLQNDGATKSGRVDHDSRDRISV
jgi:6-phosphogluconolactonase